MRVKNYYILIILQNFLLYSYSYNNYFKFYFFINSIIFILLLLPKNYYTTILFIFTLKYFTINCMLKAYNIFFIIPLLIIDAFYLFNSIFVYFFLLSISFLFNSLKNPFLEDIFSNNSNNFYNDLMKILDYSFYTFDFSNIWYLIGILSLTFIFTMILKDFKISYLNFNSLIKENNEKVSSLELKVKILNEEILKNKEEFKNFLSFLNDVEKSPFEASAKIIKNFIAYEHFYIYNSYKSSLIYNDGLINNSEFLLDFVKSLSKLSNKSYKLIKDKNFINKIGFSSNALLYYIMQWESQKIAFIILFDANKNSLFELKFFDTLLNTLNYFHTTPFKRNLEINKNMKENIEYFENANRDALTNIYSRAYLKEYKMQRDCFVAMIDCDDFKKVNDTKGHLEGDKILKKVASLINNTFEDCDAFRYGGDEFLLIIFEKDISKIISKLEGLIAKSPLSLSIGLYYSKENVLEIAKERADKALYKAKRLGKNQIVVWTKDLKER